MPVVHGCEQDIWKAIGNEAADAFVWTGDAVYTHNRSLAGLQAAYEQQKANQQYTGAIARMPLVTGVWDDHDYGVNDGGVHVTQKRERQALYLDFLDEPRQSELWTQDGLYRAVDIGEVPRAVKLLLLDTRSFRDDHIIPSIGTLNFPFSAVLAALTRLFSGVVGLTAYHTGDVLGEAQWAWLEEQLRDLDAQVHVIVSSVQVATTNPLVESWNHFPRAKERLFGLLQQYDPRGVVFVSGDVHHAELSEIAFERTDGKRGSWIEMTSSGLTHSCSEGWVLGWTCDIMLKMFNAHRQQPSSYYIRRNYGVMEIAFGDDDEDVTSVRLTIKDVDGATVLSTQQVFDGEGTDQPIASVYPLPLPGVSVDLLVTIAAAVIVPMFLLLLRSSLSSSSSK